VAPKDSRSLPGANRNAANRRLIQPICGLISS
jgi:hypothetical protein